MTNHPEIPESSRSLDDEQEETPDARDDLATHISEMADWHIDQVRAALAEHAAAAVTAERTRIIGIMQEMQTGGYSLEAAIDTFTEGAQSPRTEDT